jgi:hypothetical protein
MKDKIHQLLLKYDKKYTKLQHIIDLHEARGCWCDECSEANYHIEVVTDIYNDLCDIFNEKIK